MAVQALDERVGEDADVTGCHPHLLRQDDARVEADDVVAARDHVAPPLALDVLLQLDAEGPVVPRRPGSAVDLAGLEDEAPVLCEGDDGFETAGCGHGGSNGPGSGEWPGKRHGATILRARAQRRNASDCPEARQGGAAARGIAAATLCASRSLSEGATMWDFVLRSERDRRSVRHHGVRPRRRGLHLPARPWAVVRLGAHRDRRAHRGRDRRRRRAVVRRSTCSTCSAVR